MSKMAQNWLPFYEVFILSLKVSQTYGLDDFFLNTNIWPQHDVSLERSILKFPNLTQVEIHTSGNSHKWNSL